MPIQTNVSYVLTDDKTVNISLNPPAPIGGMAINFNLMHRFGSTTPIATFYLASGYSGASGLTVINSGQGIFKANLFNQFTSGTLYGPLAFTAVRMDSGHVTTLVEGYLNQTP